MGWAIVGLRRGGEKNAQATRPIGLSSAAPPQ
jgi:hypothetical protein